MLRTCLLAYSTRSAVHQLTPNSTRELYMPSTLSSQKLNERRVMWVLLSLLLGMKMLRSGSLYQYASIIESLSSDVIHLHNTADTTPTLRRMNDARMGWLLCRVLVGYL